MCQKAVSACAAGKPLSSAQTVDEKRRNRHETRTITVFDAKAAVKDTEWTSHVAAIIRVERSVCSYQPSTGLWKRSHESSIYLSNRLVDAKTAACAIRNHWSIENTSHHTRDVTLREDASRIRKNPGVFARMRSWGYNILRCNQSDTIAQDRFAAAIGGIEAVLAMTFSKER